MFLTLILHHTCIMFTQTFCFTFLDNLYNYYKAEAEQKQCSCLVVCTVLVLMNESPDKHLQPGVAVEPAGGDGHTHGQVEERAGHHGLVHPHHGDHQETHQLGAMIGHQGYEPRGDAVLNKESQQALRTHSFVLRIFLNTHKQLGSRYVSC